MATSIQNLLLRITGDNRQAKQSLREVAAELSAYSATDAEARVGIDGGATVRAELQRLETALTLIGRRDVTARVRVKVDSASAELGRLRRELDLALAGGAGARPLRHVLRDVSLLSRNVSRVGGVAASVGGAVAGLFSAVGQGVAKVGGSVVSSLLRMIGMVGALTIVFVLLFPAISAVVGVLVGLIGSLGAAIAGAGALAVAFGFVLLPVIAVLGFAIKRMVDVIGAASKAKKEARQNAKDLAEALKDQGRAAEASADAQVQVQRTLQAAYRAQRDAVDELKSAQIAQQEAVLGIGDADVRLERAKERLRELKGEAAGAGVAFANLFRKLEDVDFRPGAKLRGEIAGVQADTGSELDVKEAMLDLAHAYVGVDAAAQTAKDAADGVADATQRQAEFTEKGTLAYEPYVAALKGAEQANEALAEATARVTEIQEKQAVLRDEQDQRIGSGEAAFARQMLRTWESIKRLFRGVQKPIFDAILFFLQQLERTLGDPAIQRGFRQIGEAIGFVIRAFGSLIAQRDVRDIFGRMATQGARLTRILGGRVFVSFFRILLNIADIAAPRLINGMRRLAAMTERWARRSGTEGFRATLNRLIDSTRRWLGFFRAVARLVLSFFGAGKEEGDRLVTTLTRMANRARRWIDQEGGRQKIIDWIKNSAAYIRDELIPALQTVLDVFKAILATIEGVKDAYRFLSNLPGGRFLRAIAGAAGAASAGGNVIRGAREGYSEDSDVGTGDSRKERRIAELAVAIRSPRWMSFRDPVRKRILDEISRLAGRRISGPRSLARAGYAWGGVIPGMGGFGDDQQIGVEGGEYMIRRSIVQAIGASTLDRVNAGVPLDRAGGGARGGIHIDAINLPPAPGAAIPDARYQAVQLARELARRGGGGS